MTVSAAELEALTELAVRAARAAGELLVHERPADGDLGVETKTSATDVVTEMDQRSERLLHAMLTAERPGDGYLGEEGAIADSVSGITWVVDPIDGTVNYLYRLPVWAVSIAACVADESAADGLRGVVGVVHAPMLGETFWAAAGQGAYVRSVAGDTRVHGRHETRLAHALVTTGFGYEARSRVVQGATAAALLPQVRDLRRPGSAALDICFVAAGRVDAYYERGTHAWDRAAAALIAREAGMVVGGPHGQPESYTLTMAANPVLFPQLEHALLAAGALTPPADQT